MAPRGRDNGTHQNTHKKDDNKIKQRKIVFSLFIADPAHGTLVLRQFLPNGISHLHQ